MLADYNQPFLEASTAASSTIKHTVNLMQVDVCRGTVTFIVRRRGRPLDTWCTSFQRKLCSWGIS
jgi:hypothetical protein